MPPGPIQARTAGEFPAKSYMLSNEGEFFAMTASTYLYGRIQRDPDTREKHVSVDAPIFAYQT